MRGQATPTLRERLDGLAAFLPAFELSEFSFGAWGGGERTAGGTFTMPYYDLSKEAAAFVEAAYNLRWVVPGFDWGEWKGTAEAERLRDDPDALASAAPDQLAKLLTLLICQDRFVEGELSAAFESGLLTQILQRAEALRREAGD
jgi:hypothetical protein